MTPYPVPLADLFRRRPMTRVRLDAEGVPVYRYGGPCDANAALGDRRNPVIIGWWALAALERGDREAFLRLARWMLDHLAARPGGSAAWECDFPYAMGPARAVPPFTGGQALGVGMSVLARAGFAQQALRALPLFRTPARAGGVRYEDAHGVFYGLEGDLLPVAVFDGIAFACLGLRDLHEATGSPEAAEALRAGVAGLRARFPGWDCHGGWSRMWIGGPPCSAFYHLLNVRTARALGLTEAADRWERALRSPGVRARAWAAGKVFFLNGLKGAGA